jgi:hypothetical protein
MSESKVLGIYKLRLLTDFELGNLYCEFEPFDGSVVGAVVGAVKPESENQWAIFRVGKFEYELVGHGQVTNGKCGYVYGFVGLFEN